MYENFRYQKHFIEYNKTKNKTKIIIYSLKSYETTKKKKKNKKPIYVFKKKIRKTVKEIIFDNWNLKFSKKAFYRVYKALFMSKRACSSLTSNR